MFCNIGNSIYHTVTEIINPPKGSGYLCCKVTLIQSKVMKYVCLLNCALYFCMSEICHNLVFKINRIIIICI